MSPQEFTNVKCLILNQKWNVGKLKEVQDKVKK
jgi:hypothetical protein